MSFSDALGGLAKGLARRGRIHRLCQQAGWTVDGDDGQKITLDFKCPFAGTRPLFIRNGDGEVVQIEMYSLTIVPASEVPEEIFAYLLMQNTKLPFGMWQVSSNDERKLFFSLSYCALGDAMFPPIFKTICERMAVEVIDFDRRMHKAGLL